MHKNYELEYKQQTEIDEIILNAKDFYEKGELEEAIKNFSEALKKDPSNKNVKKYLAVCMFGTRELDDAENLFRDLLIANPEDPEINNNLGMTLYEQGEVDSSIVYLKKAVQYAPDNADYLYNLGKTQLNSLEFSVFDEIIEMNFHKEQDGLNNLQKVLQKVPNHIKSHKVLCDYYLSRSDYKKAYYHANQILLHSKEKPARELLRNLAHLSEQLNYYIESVMWGLNIIESNPEVDTFLAIARNLEKIDEKKFSEQIIQSYKAYCSLYFEKKKTTDSRIEDYLFEKYGVRMNKFNRDVPPDDLEINNLSLQIKKILLQ